MPDNSRKVSKFFRPKKTSTVINDDKKNDEEGLSTTVVDGGEYTSPTRKAAAVTEKSVAFFGGGAVEEDSKTNLNDQASDNILSNDDGIENNATASTTTTVDLTTNHSEDSTASSPSETIATNRKDPVSLRDRESTDRLSSSSPTPPKPPPPISSSPEQVVTQKRRKNPFEMFAHAASRPTSKPMSSSFLRQWNAIGDRTNSSSWKMNTNKQKKQKTSTGSAMNVLRNKSKECNSTDFVRMKDEPLEEQNRVTKKWLSFADDPPPEILSILDFDRSDDGQSPLTEASASAAKVNDFIEMRRFQVLVAARLHARCQEPSVIKALQNLKKYFGEDKSKPVRNDTGVVSGNEVSRSNSFDCKHEMAVDIATNRKATITLDEIASADPDDLARECLTNLQYYNSKAEHIVKAAQEVQKQHRGIVPEDEHSLLRLTGIGRVFADLLAFVNTKEKHIQFMLESFK